MAPSCRSGSKGERPNLVYPYKGFSHGPADWRVKQEALDDIVKSGNLAWNKTGGMRRKLRPSDIEKGRPIGSLWDDIERINCQAQERVGYPTQKPIASARPYHQGEFSNPGACSSSIPSAGCATACVAAEKLGTEVGRD